MAKKIVAIGKIEIGRFGDELMCVGVGSCVAVAIYDSNSKIAGLIHVFLPTSKKEIHDTSKATRFADIGIKCLIEDLQQLGAKKIFLKAKLAGGASLFSNENKVSINQIGRRNIEMCLKMLKEYKIPIVSQDVGGEKGRSVVFQVGSMDMKVKKNSKVKII